MNSVYSKFQANYLRITACGLNIYEKAQACSSVLTGPRYNYILLIMGQYFFAPCQHYTMAINRKSRYFYFRHYRIRAFRCPTAVRVDVTAHKNPIGLDQHRGITYFISGVTQPNSFIMHYEHERYSRITGSQMKPEMLVQNIPRNRFKLAKFLERIKPFESFAKIPEHAPHLPTASKRITRQSTFVIRKPMQAESMVFDLMIRVKRNTLSKFFSFSEKNVIHEAQALQIETKTLYFSI